MKKILMGLIAVTSLSFAAQPDIAGAANNNSTVWEEGRTDSINLTVKLISDVLTVRFVVYASEDGVWGAGASDEWVLPTVQVINDALTNIFATDTSMTNIYVKRVNSNKDNVEVLQSGKVTFTLGIDPLYTSVPKKIRKDAEVGIWLTSVLPKSELDSLAQAVGGNVNVAYGVNNASNQVVIRTPNKFKFYSDEEGVLKVTQMADELYGKDSVKISSRVYDKYIAWFGTEKTNTMVIKVTLN